MDMNQKQKRHNTFLILFIFFGDRESLIQHMDFVFSVNLALLGTANT